MKFGSIDRRSFLQTGVVLSTAAVAGTALCNAAAAGIDTPFRFARFVADRRFPAAMAAGRAARRDGIQVAEVAGDMSQLWYEDLDLAWRRGPMTLAGITGPDGLFVLETLAADRGMRVIFRAERGPAAGGECFHRVRGPVETATAMSRCLAIPEGDVAIGTGAYAAMAGCPVGARPVATVGIGKSRAAAERACDRYAADRDPTLVAWIIAPRGTATPVPAA